MKKKFIATKYLPVTLSISDLFIFWNINVLVKDGGYMKWLFLSLITLKAIIGIYNIFGKTECAPNEIGRND